MNALAIITFLSFFFSSPAHAAQAPEPAWEPEPALHDTPMVVKTQPSASSQFAKTWKATSLGLLIGLPGIALLHVGLFNPFNEVAFAVTGIGVAAAYILVPSWLAHQANGGEWWPQLIGSAVGWGVLGYSIIVGTLLGIWFDWTNPDPRASVRAFFGPVIVGLVVASFGPYVGYRIHEKAKSNNPEPKKASWGVTPMYTGERFVPALAVTGRFG